MRFALEATERNAPMAAFVDSLIDPVDAPLSAERWSTIAPPLVHRVVAME